MATVCRARLRSWRRPAAAPAAPRPQAASGNLFDGGQAPSPMEEVAEAAGDTGSAAALPQIAVGSLLYGGAGSALALQQTAVGSAATAAGGGITLRLRDVGGDRGEDSSP